METAPVAQPAVPTTDTSTPGIETGPGIQTADTAGQMKAYVDKAQTANTNNIALQSAMLDITAEKQLSDMIFKSLTAIYETAGRSSVK
jgi:hypothetical protein